MADDIRYINITRIVDPHQPMRSELELASIAELSASIKQNGLINPITVRPVKKDGSGASVAVLAENSDSASGDTVFFEVVAGHRRITACRLAALAEVPCVVRYLTDDEAMSIMAHENLERQDVDPVDEALMIGRYVGEDETKIEAVAKLMHRSADWVRARLAILEFPDYLVLAIKEGKITLGVANWLGGIKDETYQKMFVMQAIRDGMKIWQAETLFRQWEGGLFKAGVEILPPTDNPNAEERQMMRVECAKCRKTAIEPNFVMVYIHRECPPEDEIAVG